MHSEPFFNESIPLPELEFQPIDDITGTMSDLDEDYEDTIFDLDEGKDDYDDNENDSLLGHKNILILISERLLYISISLTLNLIKILSNLFVK